MCIKKKKINPLPSYELQKGRIIKRIKSKESLTFDDIITKPKKNKLTNKYNPSSRTNILYSRKSIMPSKIDIIKNYLKKIRKRKSKYRENYLKLKKSHDISDSILNGLSAITTTSFVISFSSANPITLIIGCVCSSVSSIGIVCKKAYGLHDKVEQNKNAYDNYSVLEREIILILTNFNKYDDDEIDLIIQDLNNRLDLIENVTPIISESDLGFSKSPLI
jgi:hypothetical protein